MSVYRFVGSHAQIGDRVLDRFGASIELSDDEALHALAGGAAIVTEREFEGAGFTAGAVPAGEQPQAGQYFEFPGQWAGANAGMLAARGAAWALAARDIDLARKTEVKGV